MTTLRLETVTPPYTQLPGALVTLDITLESELALFRQQQRPHSPARLLPDVLATASPRTGSALDQPPGEVGEDLAIAGEFGEALPFQASQAPDLSAPDVAASVNGSVLPGDSAPVAGEGADGDVGLTATAPEASSPEAALSEPVDTDNTDAGLGEAVAAKAFRPSTLDDSAPLESYLDPAIEDYLESSEALLKHLEAEELPTLHDHDLPVPWAGYRWGLAVAVGVLLGGLFIWHLARQRQPEPLPETPAATSQSPAAGTAPPASNPSPETAAVSPLAPITTPSGPNLASREFPALNLSNLGQLTPQSEPAPAATEEASLFFVVVDGSAAVNLEAARTVVPEAFDNGTEIQLGALESEMEAQRLAEQLRSQGLPAKVVTN